MSIIQGQSEVILIPMGGGKETSLRVVCVPIRKEMSRKKVFMLHLGGIIHRKEIMQNSGYGRGKGMGGILDFIFDFLKDKMR